jgi:carbon-monoxide dehydrogenase large subunit
LPLDRGATGFANAHHIIYDEGDYPRCLEAGLKLAEYENFESDRKAAAARGKLRGLGISMYVEITAVGPYETARIALQPDGTVLLFSSIMPVGQGSETTQRQLVAEELGVAMEQVAIRQGDTDEVPDAVGTFASRGAAVGGAVGEWWRANWSKNPDCFAENSNAIRRPALGRRRRNDLGPVGRVHSAVGNSGAAGVAPGKREPENGIEAKYRIEIPRPSYSYATHIAVVEIDPETGRLKIPRYVVAHDCGRIVNPLLVEGQIVGGVVQGIGAVLREMWSTIRRDVSKLGHDGLRFARRVRCSGGFQTLAHGNAHEFQSVWDARRRRGRNHRSARAVANAVADALRDYDVAVDGSGPFTPTWILRGL